MVKARKQRVAAETVLSIDCQASSEGGKGGGEVGKGGGTGGPKPEIKNVRVAPARFRAAGHGGSIAAAVGTKVSYRLSIAASTKLVVEHVLAGVKKAKKCVAPSKERHGASCTRYVKVGSLRYAGKAGANHFRFSGRLHSRRLAPGTYRFVLTARKGKGPSSAAVHSAKFHIVR